MPDDHLPPATAGSILLSCSFLRPLRKDRGEWVDTAGWVDGPPEFLDRAPFVDHVDEGAPNPFFRSGPEDRSWVRSQMKRERYFQDRMRALLYPRIDGPVVRGRRRHSVDVMTLEPQLAFKGLRSRQAPSRITVIARELLELDIPDVLEGVQYLGIHVLVEVPQGNDPFAAYANARDTVNRDESMAAAGITLTYTPEQTVSVQGNVHLLLPRGRSIESVMDDHAAQDGQQELYEQLRERLSASDLALTLLSGAKTLGDKAPDPDDPSIMDGVVRLSSEWRGFASRQGLAFLGLTPYDGDSWFHPAGRSLAQSMYFDALLLGRIQLDAANRIADTVVDIDLATASAADTDEAERRLLDFRSKVWWSLVTEQSEIVTRLLVTYQRQQHLPELVEQFNQDLQDLARFQSLRREARLNQAIGVLTAVFVAPTLVLALVALYLAQESWAPVLVGIALSIVSGGLAYGAWSMWSRRERPRRRLD